MYQKQIFNFICITGVSVILWGCKPQPAIEHTPDQASAAIDSQHATDIPVVFAQMEHMVLDQAKVCESNEPCRQYRIDWAKTNLEWLNDILLATMKKHDATPFTQLAVEQVVDPAFAQMNNSTRAIVLRYLGQHEDIASFVMETQSYDAGAAQGTSHDQYLLFDLKNKKRIHLADLLQTNMQAAVLDALYEYNREWLADHQIKPANLALIDNFYFDPNGVVFVYPTDQFASVSEDLTEFTLPYYVTKDLIHDRYLPSTWAFVLDE